MCNDASLTYLNELGYNVVRFPRADIQPLDILGRQRKTLARLGRLPQLAMPDAGPLPAIRVDVHAANLEARRSSKLDAEAAVTVLGPYLKSLGGNPEVSAFFHRVKSLQIVFTDVLLDEAAPAEIGAFLGRCQIDRRNILWRPYLAGEGELFVITEILKSRKLTVAAESGSQAGVGLDAGALQAAVGGKVGVSGGGKESSLLSFDGSEPMVFGFKCVRLQIAGGDLALLCAPASAALAFSVKDSGSAETPAPLAPEPVLLGEGLLKLRPSRSPRADSASEAPTAAADEADDDATAAPLSPPASWAPLPEEDSPAAPVTDEVLLYVRLLDAALRPRAGGKCRVRGPIDPERPAHAAACEVDVELRADDEGVLLLDGCPPGAYALDCDAGAFTVHTLRQRDLVSDTEPYRLVVGSAP